VEIAFEIKSRDIKNLSQESMHKSEHDVQATFLVRDIFNAEGKSLWEEEACGKDRNQISSPLESKHLYVVDNNQKFKWAVLLEGKKSIRLKSGVASSDVAEIKGEIMFFLPTEVETQVIPVPLAGKVVETDLVRVLFKKGKPDNIEYEISGRPSHILRVQGLNSDKQALATDGSMGMDRMGGPGKSVTKDFKGQIAFAEVVVAKRVESHTYPFSIQNVEPRFGEWTWPEPFRVQLATTKTYLALKRQSRSLQKLCTAEKFSFTKPLNPFAVCVAQFEPIGSRLWGGMYVYAPASKALEKNLAAAELVINSIHVIGKTTQAKRTLPLQFAQFISLKEKKVNNNVHLQEYVNIQSKEKLELKDEEIIGFGGHLIMRLPLKFSYAVMDVRNLGNEIQTSPKGIHAKLIGFSDGKLKLRITGPRAKIVQFIPRDAAETPLATNTVTIKPDENQPSTWIAEISVSGRPHSLVIVTTKNQKTVKIPFQAKK